MDHISIIPSFLVCRGAQTSDRFPSVEPSSSHADQLYGYKQRLFTSAPRASSVFFCFSSTTPYRYNNQPSSSPHSSPSTSPSLFFVEMISCRLVDIPCSSLFAVAALSNGPNIISLSSSRRFSPAMYRAYRCRNRDFTERQLASTAEDRSYSRTSKYDLARRNCGSSAASSAASEGVVDMGWR